MTIAGDLMAKDGWRKFTFAIWVTSLAFIALMMGKMTGDAFGLLAGATMTMLSAAVVGERWVDNKAVAPVQ